MGSCLTGVWCVPGLPAPCSLATLVWAGEVAGGVIEGGAVQAGVGVGLLLGSPLLAQVGTGRTAVLVIFESERGQFTIFFGGKRIMWSKYDR